MAGVAPQQRGGSNASTVAMVTSIVVAVVLAGVLIWLFTQQEQLRTNAQQATVAKEKLAKGNDDNVARQLVPDASGTGKTIVGELNRAVKLLCLRMTGNEQDVPQVAVGKLDTIIKQMATDQKVPDPEKVSGALGASTILENLYQLYVEELTARKKAEEDRDKAVEDVKAAALRNDELEKNFSGDLAKLSQKVEELQTAKSEFETLKTTEIDALAKQISSKQDELSQQMKQEAQMKQRLATQLGERDKLLDEQKTAIASLRGPGPMLAQDLGVARTPVGRILRALPGDSLVHIDLGRRDNVTLGLTFSVYSAGESVPSDGRGKANLEVVSVGERTAEARVMTPPSPDNPILEGDSVGNIVLSRDKGKKQRFSVIGQFDTDFDGTVDPRGADAVKALVRRYGGEVVDQVDAMTDYVVVGVPPKLPETEIEVVAADEAEADADADAEEDTAAKSDDESGDEEAAADEEGAADEEAEKKPEAKPEEPKKPAPAIKPAPEIDPTLPPRTRRVLSERDKYEEAIHRAEKLSIPRLPTERFYNFIGLEGGQQAKRQLEQ